MTEKEFLEKGEVAGKIYKIESMLRCIVSTSQEDIQRGLRVAAFVTPAIEGVADFAHEVADELEEIGLIDDEKPQEQIHTCTGGTRRGNLVFKSGVGTHNPANKEKSNIRAAYELEKPPVEIEG